MALEYLPRPHHDKTGLLPEDLLAAKEYDLDVSVVGGLGPAVEPRDLLLRLYGRPQDNGRSNPHLAPYRRLRASLRPELASGSEQAETADPSPDRDVGSIEYRHWPSLQLGYLETIQVSTEVRRQGVGIKLVDFAVEHLARLGCQCVYAFIVSPEGASLFASAGFSTPEPRDGAQPWRDWVVIATTVEATTVEATKRAPEVPEEKGR